MKKKNSNEFRKMQDFLAKIDNSFFGERTDGVPKLAHEIQFLLP